MQEAGDHVFQLDVGVKGKNFWVTQGDLLRAREWFGHGFTLALKTPDNTLVFVTPEEAKEIRKDRPTAWAACRNACSQLGGHRDQLDRPACRSRSFASRRRCKISPMAEIDTSRT